MSSSGISISVHSKPCSVCFFQTVVWAKRFTLLRCSLALACVLLCVGVAEAQVNIYTRSFDNARTGANLQETTLTPANVNSTQFGKLFTVNVDGEVYAQPLYVSNLSIAGGAHNVVYIATMNNSLYALDADNGARLWTKNFGEAIASGDMEVGSVIARISTIGIMSTPVIDPATEHHVPGSRLRNSCERNAGLSIPSGSCGHSDRESGAGKSHQHNSQIHGRDFITPLTLNHSIPDSTFSVWLSPTGNVYFGFGANGDKGPWHGWVLSYNASTLAQNGVYVDTKNYGGGVWMAGSAPAIDQNGDLYISTGNGDFGLTANKVQQTGESVVKLSPASNCWITLARRTRPR